MKNVTGLAIRRFTDYRNDGRCFELYEVYTGKCASFPSTRKALEIYLRKLKKGELSL